MDKTLSEWKLVEDKEIEDFKIFSLRKSTRINPRSNKAHTFLLMSGLDWVNLIALTPEKEVILVNQYRHGSESATLEFPGGCVEINEDPADSARRELEEETGYTVTKIEPLGSLHANPALQSIKVHSFIAYGAQPNGRLKLDQGEDIKTVKMPLTEFLLAVKNGQITHALIVAAVGLFLLKHPEISSLDFLLSGKEIQRQQG